MKNRSLRVALVVLASVVALPLGREVWVRGEVSRTRELRDRVAQELASRDARRPVLHGESLAGNAFDEYARFGDLVKADMSDDWTACQLALHEGSAEGVALRDRLLDEHRELLATLERGARSEEARFCVVGSSSANWPKLMTNRWAADLATLAVVRHLDEGDPARAVDVWLDGIQLGRDHVEVPLLVSQAIGSSLLSIASDGTLLDHGELDRLPAAELARLAEGLLLVDAGLDPLGDSLSGELLYVTDAFERGVVDAGYLGFEPTECQTEAWRNGFSTRAMFAEYIGELVELRDELRTIALDPGGEQVRALEACRERALAAPNPLVQRLAEPHSSFALCRKRSIAHLRLLRAAVEFRLTGEVPALADPFGDTLRVREENGRRVVASVGAPGQASGYPLEIVLPD